jgi:hypothetical protein
VDGNMTNQEVAKDIISVITRYYYSKDQAYVCFRYHHGCRGVINAVIDYIQDTYLTEGKYKEE